MSCRSIYTHDLCVCFTDKIRDELSMLRESPLYCCLPQVKIGDFGFTKRLAHDRASLRVARITHPRWVAPEVSVCVRESKSE